jgi:homoserine dehydrogenase
VGDGLEIRPARPSDARAFLEFWTAIVAEERFVRTEEVRTTRRQYRRLFRKRSPAESHLLAFEGGRLVGHVTVQREQHPVTHHVGSLAIAVAADVRGRGIGRRLMEEALAWSTGAGIEKLVLSVYPHNEAAIALYRSFGFVEEGRLARHSRKSYGYEDEILMAAWIGGTVTAEGTTTADERTVRIGLLGSGTVGAAVIRLLHEHGEDVARRAGVRLEIVAVAVRDPRRDRDVPLPPDRFTDDPGAVVGDPGTDIVCELMGGVEPARELLLRALASGKSVVTANKELLASHGEELFTAAEEAGGDLYFEAAVAGGIPLIRPLRESLAGERVGRVLGIVNGTTNFILTQMSEHGWTSEEAVAEAQRLGFAEADPTADVDGYDAAAKCAILASVAFGARVVASDVYREGISKVTPQDFQDAARLGYVIKLLAIAELDDEEIAVRVHPSMIPVVHPLAAVRGASNAVFVEGPKIGQLMFYGAGAGGDPTATAVVGDLVSVARNLLQGARGPGSASTNSRRVRPMDDTHDQYYLKLRVDDRPGVLAEIADRFGRNGISLERVWQEGFGDEATLSFITHRAQEGAFQKTMRELGELDAVHAVASVLRVEGEE